MISSTGNEEFVELKMMFVVIEVLVRIWVCLMLFSCMSKKTYSKKGVGSVMGINWDWSWWACVACFYHLVVIGVFEFMPLYLEGFCGRFMVKRHVWIAVMPMGVMIAEWLFVNAMALVDVDERRMKTEMKLCDEILGRNAYGEPLSWSAVSFMNTLNCGVMPSWMAYLLMVVVHAATWMSVWSFWNL